MRYQRPPTPSLDERKGSSIPRSLLLRRALLALSIAIASAACAAPAPAGAPGPTSSTAASSPTSAGAPSRSSSAGAVTTPAATAPGATASGSPVAADPCPGNLVDDEGDELRLEHDPDRVVSLSPANTEIMFALGQGDKVVGGTDFDDYPPEAAALPDVASFQGVMVEKVVDLEPDLVLAAGNAFNPPEDLDRLRSLDIPVLVVYAETVDEVLADIRLIGCAVGAGEEAAELTAEVAARMAEVEAAVSALRERPRVFYEIDASQEIYGPAEGSFIADMIERAGGDPITTGSRTAFSVPLERLVDHDPEVIVLGDANYGVTPEQVRQRPGGWRQMTAVRTGQIRPVNDLIVTRPGPRLAEGLEALARAIHPDIALPGDSPGASRPAGTPHGASPSSAAP